MTNLDSILKSRDITLSTKVHLVKATVFPVVMYGWESWTIKKAECRRIDALELWCWRRLLRVPWTARRSNQSILKEISPERRTDAEAETPILWLPDVKNWVIGKDPDAGKDWGQEDKGMTEDKTAGWHHRLNGHEFGYTLGVGDRQGGLACCSPWGHKQLDMTEQLNWTDSWNHNFVAKEKFVLWGTTDREVRDVNRYYTRKNPACWRFDLHLVARGFSKGY